MARLIKKIALGSNSSSSRDRRNFPSFTTSSKDQSKMDNSILGGWGARRVAAVRKAFNGDQSQSTHEPGVITKTEEITVEVASKTSIELESQIRGRENRAHMGASHIKLGSFEESQGICLGRLSTDGEARQGKGSMSDEEDLIRMEIAVSPSRKSGESSAAQSVMSETLTTSHHLGGPPQR